MLKNKFILISVLIVVALSVLFAFVRHKASLENPYLAADIQIKTFKEKTGWGYDIYINNSLLIHQPNIPAIAGNKGFAEKADAQKTAELVVGKIRKNILPPALTTKELREIEIIKK